MYDRFIMNISLQKCRKRINDVIYTPLSLAIDCISCVPINRSDTILDPFLGGGVFFDNYPENNIKDWCEIEKGKDFFEYEKRVDWIISNPPFSKMNEVLNKCAELSIKGFGLIMLSTALTIPRIERMKSKGFIISRIMYFNVKEWFCFTCVFVLFEYGGNCIFSIEPKKY